MKTFVDTGGWISVVVETDQYHDLGVLHYEELMSRRERLFTSDYVLDETVTRIRYDDSHAAAAAFLDLIHEAERLGSLTVLRVDVTVWEAAETIFRKYHDSDFSFTDCTSFVLAQQAEIDVLMTVLNQQRAAFHKDPSSAIKLLSVGESKRNEKLDTVELAAWTTVGSVILNLDETITKG